MIRIGLVGCGHIGTVHAVRAPAALRRASSSTPRLTRDLRRRPERAEQVARHHGGEPAASLAELVAGVDVVWVCTWTAAHLEAVEAAADAGRPVFCEKPLGPDLASARAGRAPRSSACRTRSGWCCAGRRCSQRAAEIIASGEYGRPLATVLRDDQYFPIQGFYGSTWRKDVAHAGGGTLIEHSIHDIDVLRWLLGDPVSVSAHTASRFGHPGIEDTAAVTFAYDDGSVAQLTSVWHQVLTRESGRHLEVFCEGAALWTDDDYLGPLHVQTSDGTHEVVGASCPSGPARLTVPEVYAKSIAHYGRQVKAFLDGARRARDPPARVSRRRRSAGRAPPRRPGLPIGGRRRRSRTISLTPNDRVSHRAAPCATMTRVRRVPPPYVRRSTRTNMPLSDEEQQILKEIEAQLNETDPGLVEQVSRTTLYRHAARMIRWSAFGVLVGLVLLIVTFNHTLIGRWHRLPDHARLPARHRAQRAQARSGRFPDALGRVARQRRAARRLRRTGSRLARAVPPSRRLLVARWVTPPRKRRGSRAARSRSSATGRGAGSCPPLEARASTRFVISSRCGSCVRCSTPGCRRSACTPRCGGSASRATTWPTCASSPTAATSGRAGTTARSSTRCAPVSSRCSSRSTSSRPRSMPRCAPSMPSGPRSSSG